MNEKQYQWQEFAENAEQILDDFSQNDVIKITDHPLVVISVEKYREFLNAKKYVLESELKKVGLEIDQLNRLKSEEESKEMAEITIEVETELLQQVQALCDQNGTTIEIIVNRFLIACVNNESWAIELLKAELKKESQE